MSSSQSSVRALKTLRQNVNLRKVGPIRRLVASRSLTALFVLSLSIVAACLYIWQRVVTLDLIEEVSKLEDVNRTRRDALMKVESEVAELSRFGRIAQLADEKFGLKQVRPEHLYAVRFGEETPGENGLRQMWDALRRSLKDAPSLKSSNAVASDIFDEREK